jgi:hypothetical protein
MGNRERHKGHNQRFGDISVRRRHMTTSPKFLCHLGIQARHKIPLPFFLGAENLGRL